MPGPYSSLMVLRRRASRSGAGRAVRGRKSGTTPTPAPAQVVGHSSGVNGVWGGSPSGPPQAPPEAGPPQAPIFWRFFSKLRDFSSKFSSKIELATSSLTAQHLLVEPSGARIAHAHIPFSCPWPLLHSAAQPPPVSPCSLLALPPPVLRLQLLGMPRRLHLLCFPRCRFL